jgi:hypothetical protein
MGLLGQDGFQPAGQVPAWQEDAPPAACALQADVGPQSDDDPFIGTTRVRLAQSDAVVELQVREHGRILTSIP